MLIDECEKVCSEMIENGVLRCNKSQVEQLINILDSHANGK